MFPGRLALWGQNGFPAGRAPGLWGSSTSHPTLFPTADVFRNPPPPLICGLRMIADGADIIDIGGESSRPGAAPVDRRRGDRPHRSGDSRARAANATPLSVDTVKAAVAREALAAGACIINDISACTADPNMAKVASDSRSGLVLMHMQGTPRTMQDDPRYGDVVAEVRGVLEARAAEACGPVSSVNVSSSIRGLVLARPSAHNVSAFAGVSVLAEQGSRCLWGCRGSAFLVAFPGHPLTRGWPASLAAAAWCAWNRVQRDAGS